MPRHQTVARLDLWRAAPYQPAPLHLAGPIDLLSLRLVLRQHLEELRCRGADETVLTPIEAELRRWSDTLDDLVRWD